MPARIVTALSIIPGICGKCGHKLDSLNKTSFCRNPQACRERVEAKFAQQSKMAVSKEGLNYEMIFEAICEHFQYDEAQKRNFLSPANLKEYHHARYTLVHLLLNDLGLPHTQAAGYLGRDRKMATAAHQDVVSNPTDYIQDLEAIRVILRKKKAERLTQQKEAAG